MKNELNTCFQQKIATSSYEVGIGRAWCSRKACEICSSLIQKKKLKKNYYSSHKLPKQQSTSFWSQGILGVKLLYMLKNSSLKTKEHFVLGFGTKESQELSNPIRGKLNIGFKKFFSKTNSKTQVKV
jgi:hypothetical protein